MLDTRTDLRSLERENADLRQQLNEYIRETTSFRREVKENERVIREQSLELRDWKKQYAKLQETGRQTMASQDTSHNRTQSIDHQREQMRLEHDELLHHLEQQRETINDLRHELYQRKSHAESLTLQTREAVEKKEDLEHTIRKLKQLNRELSENLTECKDDLLRLQPPSQISDTEVSEHYSVLLQQIARWVDDETEDSQLLEQRFEALPANSDELPEMLLDHLSNENLKLAKKYPSAQPLVLRHLITLFLDAHILTGNVELFGLDDSAAAVIRGVEYGMKQLEPRRGASAKMITFVAPHILSPTQIG